MYSVSITLSVDADDENEALNEFVSMIENGNYDSASIDIEEEEEDD
jgi:phosphotransferase system HPr-like phosphotransfer protein